MSGKNDSMVSADSWRKRALKLRDVNEANGFDTPTTGNMLAKLMLVVTELTEAVDAWGLSSAMMEELADTEIRLLDILESVYPGQWGPYLDFDAPGCRGTSIASDYAEAILGAIGCVSEAAEAWRHDKHTEVRIALEKAFSRVYVIAEYTCATGKPDLMDEVDAKIEKNSTRGHLHGKVQSVG